ncbi:MAG: hypothetical protein ACK4R7_02880 [Fervidobacterium sp.]
MIFEIYQYLWLTKSLLYGEDFKLKKYIKSLVNKSKVFRKVFRFLIDLSWFIVVEFFILFLKQKYKIDKHSKTIIHLHHGVGDDIHLLSIIKGYQNEQPNKMRNVILITFGNLKILKSLLKIYEINEIKPIELKKNTIVSFIIKLSGLKNYVEIIDKRIDEKRKIFIIPVSNIYENENNNFLSFHDIYKNSFKFYFNSNVNIFVPKISKSQRKEAYDFFEKYGLKEDKTVIFSPEARTLIKYIPDLYEKTYPYYKELALKLMKKGFYICINGNMKIDGAINIFPPLEIFIPFLDLAGYLIGTRSGLFDLATFSNARLFVYYPQYIESNKRSYFENHSLKTNWGREKNLVEIQGKFENILEFEKYF